MPRKRTPKINDPSPVNKSKWIRDQDSSIPAPKLVEMAREKGIEISPGLVYAVRSASKGASKGAAKVASTNEKNGGIEAQIRAIVRDEIRRYFVER